MPSNEEKARMEKTRAERKRMKVVIHDFCFSGEMIDKGCVNCPLNQFDVCGETPSMEKLKKAEKMIDELMGESMR